MKRLIPVVLLGLFCFAHAFSQEVPQTGVQSLKAQLQPLLAKQKFDEVIPIAERIAKLEKGDAVRYLAARQDVARWKVARLQLARAGMKTGVTNLLTELLETRNLFDELVTLAGKQTDPLPLATVQFEFAAFRRHFGSTSPEVENLYRQSLAIREKNLHADDDLVLLTIEKLSEVCFEKGDFEGFLPLNRRLVAATEKKYGPADRRLLAPLASYARFLAMTDRDKASAQTGEQISRITGKPFSIDISWAVLGRGEGESGA